MNLANIPNGYLRVWFLDPDTHRRYYGRNVSIFRVMFEGDRARVILKEIMIKGNKGELEIFKDGSQIAVMYGEYGRPDEWNNGMPLFTFTNCTKKRAWIPHLVAGSFDETSSVIYYLEVWSGAYDRYRINDEARISLQDIAIANSNPRRG